MASAEDDLIARYFRPLATHAGALGLIDDAAILAASGEDIVVTTDAIVEGVHFLPNDPPATLAQKALRVNLSDLAAKGAVPAGFVLTLALRDVEVRVSDRVPEVLVGAQALQDSVLMIDQRNQRIALCRR